MASQRVESQGSPSLATRLLQRATDGVNLLLGRADECRPQEDVDLCEKPRASTQTVTWIVVGVVLGLLLVGSLCVLLFFHMKKRKLDKREDMEDQFQMSDYGLDDRPGARQKKPPQGEQRLSFDDLPQPGGPPNRNLGANPFSDDAVSVQSAEKPNQPGQPWPKRVESTESSQTNLPATK